MIHVYTIYGRFSVERVTRVILKICCRVSRIRNNSNSISVRSRLCNHNVKLLDPSVNALKTNTVKI